jgi:hypothetical protein
VAHAPLWCRKAVALKNATEHLILGAKQVPHMRQLPSGKVWAGTSTGAPNGAPCKSGRAARDRPMEDLTTYRRKVPSTSKGTQG